MATDIKHLITAASTRRTTFDKWQDRYNDALIGIAKKTWRGMLAVASSGFGKGLLVTIGVTIALSAMLTGFDFSAIANLPFEDGFVQGIGRGLAFLASSFGLTTLAVGGTLGAVSSVRKEQGRISAEIAQAEALEYETIRQIQQEKNINQATTLDPNKPWEQPLAPGYAAREEQRRATAQSFGQTVN